MVVAVAIIVVEAGVREAAVLVVTEEVIMLAVVMYVETVVTVVKEAQ